MPLIETLKRRVTGKGYPYSQLGFIAKLLKKEKPQDRKQKQALPVVETRENGQISQFGPFAVSDEPLGSGAHSEVLPAVLQDKEDPLDERQKPKGKKYALKILRAEFLTAKKEGAQAEESDGKPKEETEEEIRQRLKLEKIKELANREARIHIQAATNPYIVGVVDYGEIDNRPFILEEYIAGKNVMRLRDYGIELPMEVVVAMAIQVTQGMEDAHNKGIVHRDLKADNIMVDLRHRRFVVIDFGTAHAPNEEPKIKNFGVGALRFSAPEQLGAFDDDKDEERKKPKPRTDIYSLCATISYLITGKFYHPGETEKEVKANAIAGTVNREWPLVPESLKAILEKGLSHAPEDRYQNVVELRADLLEWLKTNPNELIETYLAENTKRIIVASQKKRDQGQGVPKQAEKGGTAA